MEKRLNFNRCPVRLPLEFWSLSEQTTTVDHTRAETVDLSVGGVLLRCGGLRPGFQQRLEQSDSQFAMRIHLLGDQGSVDVTAKVVWIEDDGEGVLVRACFVSMAEEAGMRILSVVNQ